MQLGEQPKLDKPVPTAGVPKTGEEGGVGGKWAEHGEKVIYLRFLI